MFACCTLPSPILIIEKDTKMYAGLPLHKSLILLLGLKYAIGSFITKVCYFHQLFMTFWGLKTHKSSNVTHN